MKKNVLVILTVLFLLNAHAQVGSIDSTFGSNGIRFFPTGTVLKILPAPGNEYYVVHYKSGTGIMIAKYLSNGNLDLTYGNNGYSAQVVMRFADAALQDDGKIVLAGSTVYDGFGSYPDFHDDLFVARYTANGVLDSSFNKTGILTKTYTVFSYEFTRSVTVTAAYILVEGYSMTLVGDFGFVHVDVFDGTTGAQKASFLTSDVVRPLSRFIPANHKNVIAIQGDKIAIGMTQPDYNNYGSIGFSLKGYMVNGLPDNSFGQQGSITLANSPSVTAFQGDKVLSGAATYDPFTLQYTFTLARYNSDGTADNTFNGNGRKVTSIGGARVEPTIILTRGDMIYVAGKLSNPTTGLEEFFLARYNNDGSADTHFDTDGIQTTSVAGHSLSPQKMLINGNRLLLTGVSTSAGTPNAGVAMQYILEDNIPITLTCHADTTLPTAAGTCAAIVNGIDPITAVTNFSKIQYALSGATPGMGQGTASGLSFNKGITQVTYKVTGTVSVTCTFLVTVKDMEPPVITGVTINPTFLWPPNHKMVDVLVSYIATDNCGDVTTTLDVSSNEKDDKKDKDDVKGDWQIIDNHLVKLRAERSGKGNGRVYTIQITATDAAGNTTNSSIAVNVPHNNRSGPADIPAISNRKGFGEEAHGPLQVKTLSNPSTSYFTLQTSSGNSRERLTIRVINQLGMVMETRTNVPANGTLQLGQAYRDGIYIAELVQGEERVEVKLVKLK